MKVLIVIQARRGSTRLPDKVLLPVLGRPVLELMIERLMQSRYADHLLVATTTNKEDDAIVDLCNRLDVGVFRGHPIDLLDRHYQSALLLNAEVVVKIPSDCPLIDPAVVDRVIDEFVKHPGKCDYVSNLHPATYPDGNDVEVMSFAALERAWKESSRSIEREHTTPYIWDNLDQFQIGNVVWDSLLDYSMSHRWTLDYFEDYLFISSIYEALYPENPAFSLDQILELLRQRPELEEINRKYVGVNWYRNHLHELKTVGPDQTKNTKELKC